MAQTAQGNQSEMLRIIEERVIESRERFTGPWANIPVHDNAQTPRLMQRLQQPLSTYEEAIAAIDGAAAVVQRRLREDALEWPNDLDWTIMLEFLTRCHACRADAGQHCIGSRNRRVLMATRQHH